MNTRLRTRALGLALGFLADRRWGDPRRHHPVAGFGRIAGALESRIYAPRRAHGVLHEALLVGGAGLAGAGLGRLPGPFAVPVAAAVTWTVLGGRSLCREAEIIHGLLQADDLDGARRRLSHLVGRDPSGLTANEIARAVIESVAENGADAVVSPLFWGAVAGVPGMMAYRAANTLDAMVGHRSPRYAEFGWAAARFDDVANWLPARLTVAVTALLTGSPAGVRRVLATVGRDAAAHPSPNAGPVEAAFAAALGRQLGGRNRYGSVVEDRGRLGDGPPVTPADIPTAVRLHQRIATATVISLVIGLLTSELLPRRPGPAVFRRAA